MNMVADSATPIVHANFFCGAPTYSGDWFDTIRRPIINVGESLGLTKTRIMKSARNIVITYLIGKKLFLKRMNISEINVAKNNIPAAALISLSFKTRVVYPSTFSPNCIMVFIFLFFTNSIRKILCKDKSLKKAIDAPVNKRRVLVTKRRMQVNWGKGINGMDESNALER